MPTDRRILAAAAAGILALAIALPLMFDFSRDVIFPTHAVAAPGPLPAGAVRVTIETPSGDTLHGVHFPRPRSARGPKSLVIGFAGNAWNSEDAGDYLHQLYPAADVVAFHYRGYRPSTGAASADALLADAPLVHDFAVDRVDPERTVAVGFSIGSGVAASLAKQRRLDGVILVTPFDSLKTVASDLYPMLPVGLLFRHEIDAASALRRSNVRSAIVAAERDEIIPGRRTDALRRSVKNLVFDRTIPGAGHNDIYARSDFQQAMREAMAAVTG